VLRVAVAVVSVVICAWFAFGVRQAIDTDKATTILSASTHVNGHQAARAKSLLHGAGLLNPDRQVDILRAQLALERGDRRQALLILRPVVTAEPMNVAAWQLVAASATNSAILTDAYVELGRLAPPVPHSH
jgi:predicted Zn-dependent protease